MKKLKIILTTGFLAVSTFTLSIPVNAEDVLTGDTRLACEALLCLASGTHPTECVPSLDRYFSISYKYWSDTLQGRINFLNLCPTSNQIPGFVNALANGAGRCDVASLNRSRMNILGLGPISNQLPPYCAAYIGHEYVNLGDLTPTYIGTPERGGHWVTAKEYEVALATYNARIAEEDAEAAPTNPFQFLNH